MSRLAWPLCLACASVVWSAGPVSAASTTSTTAPWVPGVGGTMTIGIDQSPTGCNPNTAAGDTWADRFVLQSVLPSAFVVNDNDQAVYDSAVITQAELQSTTPETIVYTINPKAVWSDGRPITARDFVYTWEQERGTSGPVSATTAPGTVGAVTPVLPPPTTVTTLPSATGLTGPALGYRQIQSVTASNKGRTVTVVFKTPYADWQSLFDDLLPAHVLTQTGWNPSCTSVDPSIDLSGGPFVLAKVTPSEVVLTRNKRWWESPPNLDKVVIKFASGPSQLASWLARGIVGVALPDGYTEGYLESVSALPTVVTQSQLSGTFLELEFSTTSPITAQVDMRDAIAHAIDRQDLVDTVVGWADSTIVPAASHLYAQVQGGYPGPKPAPQQVADQPGSTPTTQPATPSATTPFPTVADPDATAKLLGGLGYIRQLDGSWLDASGKPLTVTLAVDTADSWASETATVLIHQLEAAGIAVTDTSEPTATATGEALSTGAADLALLPLHTSPFASQSIAWYTPLLGPAGTAGSQDWSNLDDPTLNALLLKASEQLNPDTAGPVYAQADALLWQDMAALPLFAEPDVLATSGRIAGASIGAESWSLLWSPTTWSIRVPPTSPAAKPTS